MILWWLTLAVVLIVVVVLVVYLVLIILALRRADRHVAAIAAGLRAVAGHTEPLPEHLTTINSALAALRGGLQATDRHLAAAARTFER
jgi:hypothetical protein